MEKDIVNFVNQYAKDAIKLDIGNKKVFSKIGGDPIVPAKFDWPVDKKGKEMPFFMQLDMSEFNSKKTLVNFPSFGLLYIFMDDNAINSNYPLVQGKHYQVLYFNCDTKDLEARQSDAKKYDEIYLDMNNIKMYPNSEEFDELFDFIEDLDDEQKDEYFEQHFVESQIGFIGGWPQILQSSYLQTNEMQLLQLNSIDDVVEWGDLGLLQFYMNVEDLKNLNFSNVKINLETT